MRTKPQTLPASRQEMCPGGLTNDVDMKHNIDCARERLCWVGDLDLEAASGTHHLTHPAVLNSSTHDELIKSI